MKSFADAQALVEKEQDPFYLDAFMIEMWLGQTALEAVAQYSEIKQAKDRKMQSGQGWRCFLTFFGHAKEDEFLFVMESIFRFCEYDDVQSEVLRLGLGPLSFEHQRFSDLLKGVDRGTTPKERFVALAKYSLERWCDWIDAIFHFRTHFQNHVLPDSFHPDPQQREMAALGMMQRNFGKLKPSAHIWWEWHHREAAERFKDSPKWQTLGKLAATPLRTPPAQVDEVVIMLWRW